MRERLVSVYLRLMKYAMLMGAFGGIASGSVRIVMD